MVLRWHEVLLAAMRTAGQNGAIPASRTAAIVATAVYEAVNSIDGSYTPYLAKIPAPPGASEDAAAAEAAHDALVGLFPSQATVLDLELRASLEGIPDGDAKTAGIMVGQAAAQNMLAARANDGSDKTVVYTPGTNPGDWQPTPPAFLPPAAPQWGMVTPFCLTSGSQFRPPPPPALTSPEYTAAFNQIKDVGSVNSTTRTADQTEAAIFWQGIVLPTTAQWDQIAYTVAVSQGNSLVQNARLFALANLAWADGSIACWDAKYTYNFWRPITAIRAADTDGNPDTAPDPNWNALMDTPNHPSYPSAHSTTDGAFTAVLDSFFGKDDIPFSVSFDGLPGVTRSYAGFSAAEEEAGLARIWAGFHWSFDTTAGHALGEAVGGYVFHNFLLPVGGAARVPRSPPIIFVVSGLTAGESTATIAGGKAIHDLGSGPFSAAGFSPGVSSVQSDATGAGLSQRQAVSSDFAAAASNSVISDALATEIARAQFEKAQALNHGHSVDDTFNPDGAWTPSRESVG